MNHESGTESRRRYRKLHEATASFSSGLLELFGPTRYEYRPLDPMRKEIRLLILEPGSGLEKLRCTLEHAFIDSLPPPHYETISYVCGDPTRKSIISLHGRRVRVMATSAAALRRVRLQDKPRVLWIDSICIDQDNVKERGHQVGMMYEVYSKTFRNLIWLGHYAYDMPRAIRGMDVLLQELIVETRDYADFRDIVFGSLFSRKPFSIDMHTDGFHFLRLFDNPWFSRLWIVQEVSLAPSSICYYGEFELPLTEILRSARWLRHKWFLLPKLPDSIFQGVDHAASIFDAADREYGFFHRYAGPAMNNCLRLFSGLQTADRKDVIFGILGLWQMFTDATVLPDALKPNYTLSLCEVFTKAVRFAIEESGGLAILELISEPSRETQEGSWPSWVPTFDADTPGKDAPNLFIGNFGADSSIPMMITNDTGLTYDLVVSGFLLDRITKVTRIPMYDASVEEQQEFMAGLERSSREIWLGDQAEMLETEISVVLVGGFIQGVRVSDQEALRAYRSYKMHLEEHGTFPHHDSGQVGAYSHSLDISLFRAVFHTAEGRIGIGPRCSQPGDVVAILYGCMLAMVMRPSPERGAFRLLGTSYVYGIMNGKAVQRHKEMGGEDTVFRIV